MRAPKSLKKKSTVKLRKFSLVPAFFISCATIQISLLAQETAKKSESPPSANTLDTIIVTGTYVSGRTVIESQAPIDILTVEQLESAGTPELATALGRILPSVNFLRPHIADGTSGVRPAQVRGLAPDQVLVLINGKRRHTSSLLNVNDTIGRGSSAVDFNAIPISAIERVELLRDGAAAQYGSDAIAGVINIVLKNAGSGGAASIDYGQYSAGDGVQGKFSSDAGMTFADGRGKAHFSVEVADQDRTNRAGIYNGKATNLNNHTVQAGTRNYIVGDPKVNAYALSANSTFQLSKTAQVYATAMVSDRDINSYAYYRSINNANTNYAALIRSVYPNGYVPVIEQFSKDRSFTTGIKGETDTGLTWDLGYNNGGNRMDFRTSNSLNLYLGYDLNAAIDPQPQTSFYAGAFEYTQNIINADFTQKLDWDLSSPALWSFGAEYRIEHWNQLPGEYGSYVGSGSQGFPGFNPAYSVDADRDNYSIYSGIDADMTQSFSGGVAARWENYSDFGSQLTGKISSRYEVNKVLAFRSTASLGFRAPSLVQQNYNVVTSIFSNGAQNYSGVFPTYSDVAKALGATELKPETSISYTFGVVLQPVSRLYITLDAYQITIDDRILLSSQINDANARSILTGLGYTDVNSARYFLNGANTRTRGIDLVSTYNLPIGSDSLDLTASFSHMETDVLHFVSQTPGLAATGSTNQLVGRDEIGRLNSAFPKNKFVLGCNWIHQAWEYQLMATRYGSFNTRSTLGEAYDENFGGRWVVGVSVNYRPDKQWRYTLGVDNLFNIYPEQSTIDINNNYGTRPYSNYSPFGYNGAYIYGRITRKW